MAFQPKFQVGDRVRIIADNPNTDPTRLPPLGTEAVIAYVDPDDPHLPYQLDLPDSVDSVIVWYSNEHLEPAEQQPTPKSPAEIRLGLVGLAMACPDDKLRALGEAMLQASGMTGLCSAAPPPPPGPGPSPAVIAAWGGSDRRLKVAAIKQFRNETGVSLLDAKNIIEGWHAEGRLP